LFTASLCRAQPAAANRQIFQAKGVIREFPSDGRSLVIRHEAITNYMPAMTMPFAVSDTNQLRGLQIGDTIAFQIVIAGADAWIDRITKLDSPRAIASQSGAAFRLVRDVAPLNLGDPLPEYHFTNQLGHAISTRQFLGQPFAFTFFFTRCPYPAFCPLMSANFEATEKKLLALTNAPANWHLLSISFDTAYDSPAELKAYSARYDVHPAHWSFVTGDLTEITALGDQFGEYFGHDQSGGVTHNLRTVVIDPRGRVQKIFPDNKWTSDELVAELLKAAAARR
jgi:protein SCO1/2